MNKHFSKRKFLYLFYVLSHPVDGFYEIRHRAEGSVLISLICVVLFSLSYSLNRLYASFVVNDVDPRNVDSLSELQAIFLLVFLFAVANWSITCLMGGEGRFKDIITVIGYSLVPLILTYIPATIISQIVAAKEEGFYTLLITVGTAWTVMLLVVGIMTIHNYTFGKTFWTVVLTFVAILIILFVLLMLVSLINGVYGFGYSIYSELINRV